MNTTVSRIGKPKGAKTRYRGIVKNAALLKVSTQHLRLCLDGERVPSAKLARGIARHFPNSHH